MEKYWNWNILRYKVEISWELIQIRLHLSQSLQLERKDNKYKNLLIILINYSTFTKEVFHRSVLAFQCKNHQLKNISFVPDNIRE